MTSASITILSHTCTTVILDHNLTTYTVRYWIVRSWLDIDYMADFLTHLVIIQRDWLAGISLVVIHLGGIICHPDVLQRNKEWAIAPKVLFRLPYNPRITTKQCFPLNQSWCWKQWKGRKTCVLLQIAESTMTLLSAVHCFAYINCRCILVTIWWNWKNDCILQYQRAYNFVLMFFNFSQIYQIYQIDQIYQKNQIYQINLISLNKSISLPALHERAKFIWSPPVIRFENEQWPIHVAAKP